MSELSILIEAAWPGLSADARARVEGYYELLRSENERQNLTRLIEPRDFVEGHLLDVKALLESGFLEAPCLDLGSGGGVPGLLAAAIRQDRWMLSESEGKKAEFLQRATEELGLTNVTIAPGRAEAWLKLNHVPMVCARAVGPVLRIYGWIRACSTWNKLLLFKGPRWNEEWEAFQASPFGKELVVREQVHYTTGEKTRVLVLLDHVPRGTKASTEKPR